MILMVTLSLDSGVKVISPSLTGRGSSTSPNRVASMIATGRPPRGSRSAPAGLSTTRISCGGSEIGSKAIIASPEEIGMYLTRRSASRWLRCLTGTLPSWP